MRLPLLIFLFVWAVSLKAQVNLVPNPSFEDYSDCPDYAHQIDYSDYWFQPLLQSTSEYFNSCCSVSPSFGGVGVPSNFIGYQYARTGNAYAGIGMTENVWREYIEVELPEILQENKRYAVEFYYSLAEFFPVFVDSIGVYFSSDIVFAADQSALPVIPQIYEPVIPDTLNWIRVSSSFIAEGNEKFLVIGNFKQYYSDSATNYFFIDDVSVTLDTTTAIPETEKPKLKIFPNPAGNQITIEQLSVSGNQLSVEVYDALGRLVLQSSINNQTSTIPLNLSKGIYLLRVKEKEEVVFGEKLIIE